MARRVPLKGICWVSEAQDGSVAVSNGSALPRPGRLIVITNPQVGAGDARSVKAALAQKHSPKKKAAPKRSRKPTKKAALKQKNETAAEPEASVTIKLNGNLARRWRKERQDWTDEGFIHYLLLMRKNLEELKEKCTCRGRDAVKSVCVENVVDQVIADDNASLVSSDEDTEEQCPPSPDWIDTEEGAYAAYQQDQSSDYSVHSSDDVADEDHPVKGKKRKLRKYTTESNECWVCDHVVERLVDKRPHVMAEHCELYVECNMCDRHPSPEPGTPRTVTPDTVRLADYICHLKKSHGTTTLKCPFCRCVEYTDVQSCSQHMLKKHSTALLCQCNFCAGNSNETEPVLLRPSSIKSHMLLRHSQKAETYTDKVPCEVCGTFLTPVLMHRHMKTHMKRQRIRAKLCDLCGKYFVRLQQHKTSVHKTRDQWKFECTHCKKRFAKLWNLKVHARLHTGERPYMCDVCGKGFHQRVELRLHTENNHDPTKKRGRKGRKKLGTLKNGSFQNDMAQKESITLDGFNSKQLAIAVLGASSSQLPFAAKDGMCTAVAGLHAYGFTDFPMDGGSAQARQDSEALN